MANAIQERPETTSTTTKEAVAAAQESSQKLKSLARTTPRGAVKLRVQGASGQEEVLEVPPAAVDLLGQILTHLAQGQDVTVVPVNQMLSTNEAAALLN